MERPARSRTRTDDRDRMAARGSFGVLGVSGLSSAQIPVSQTKLAGSSQRRVQLSKHPSSLEFCETAATPNPAGSATTTFSDAVAGTVPATGSLHFRRRLPPRLRC